MNLKVEDHKVMLEFPLTQPKRAWKIRKRGGRKTSPKFKYLIQEGDVFEWMTTNSFFSPYSISEVGRRRRKGSYPSLV